MKLTKSKSGVPLDHTLMSDATAGHVDALHPLPELQAYLPDDLWRRLHHPQLERRELQNVLNHLRSHLYLLSTYLPSHVVAQHTAFAGPGSDTDEPAAILNGARGSKMSGSLLFSDVSGFTQLSERLARQGPDGIERLTTVLNDYFSRMLDILARSNGILLKFAGDALLVYFPEQPEQNQAAWGLRAAWRMMDAMEAFTQTTVASSSSGGEKGIALQMKIGLATGLFHALSVGADQRREYIVLGETVARTLTAEGHAAPGQVLADDVTRQVCPHAAYAEIAPGFYIATRPRDIEIGEFEIQAEGRRRGRSTAAWIGDSAEILLEITRLHERIRTLSAYLPEELVQWLSQDARFPVRHDENTTRSENRPTVVVFVNVTGFEALLQSARTPDDGALIYSMIDDYFRSVHDVVTHFGGMISRIDPYKDGNKVLVLFGAPQAHENDVMRATRALLRLQENLLTLNRRWEQRLRRASSFHDATFIIQQRAGITYGVTFAGQVGSSTRREYTVMGDDVNLAARLMGAATPGQILASSTVARILKQRRSDTPIALTPLPPMRVKGKSRPLTIYQVEALVGAHNLDESVPCRELIGREADLSRAEAIVRAVLVGERRQVTILGSAGIGKSHFTAVLGERLAASGAQVVTARCPAFDAGAYAVWISVIQRLAGIDPAETVEVQAAHIQRLVDGLPDSEARHLQTLFGLLGLPQTSATLPSSETTPCPKQTQDSPRTPMSGGLFAQLGKRASASAPSETAPSERIGMHDVTPGSLWHITGARQRSSQSPAPTAWRSLNARITQRQQTRLNQAMREILGWLAQVQPVVLIFEDYQWIDKASAELLELMVTEPTTTPFAVIVVQRTEAADTTSPDQSLALHPLPTEQTAAMVETLLSDCVTADQLPTVSQMIYEKSQGNPLMVEELAAWWREHQGEESLTMGLEASATLSELVISRVDRLPADLRTVVQAATIPDSDFTPDALTALLAAESGRANIARELQDLTNRQILFGTESASWSRHAFRQTLVREIVYDSLTVARRSRYHDRFAAHLEANPESVQPGRLAYHHRHAGNWEAAGRYLILSGEAAARHGALAQAQSAFEAALETLAQAESTDTRHRLRGRAYEGIGDACFHRGDFVLSAASYRAADPALARASRESNTECTRVGAKRVLALFAAGNTKTAVAEEAEELYDKGQGCEFVTAAVLAWLNDHTGSGSAPQTATAWRRKAEVAAAQLSTRESTRVRAIIADLHSDWEAMRVAYAALEEPAGEGLALCHQGDAHLRTWQTVAAEVAYSAAAALWQSAGDFNGLALIAGRRANLLTETGEHDASATVLREALAWLDTACLAEATDRAMMQSARMAIETQLRTGWSSASWQSYEDSLRALHLFHVLEDITG